MSAQVDVLKPAVAANWGNDSPEYAQLVALIAERDALRAKVEAQPEAARYPSYDALLLIVKSVAGALERRIDELEAALDRAQGVQS